MLTDRDCPQRPHKGPKWKLSVVKIGGPNLVTPFLPPMKTGWLQLQKGSCWQVMKFLVLPFDFMILGCMYVQAQGFFTEWNYPVWNIRLLFGPSLVRHFISQFSQFFYSHCYKSQTQKCQTPSLISQHLNMQNIFTGTPLYVFHSLAYSHFNRSHKLDTRVKSVKHLSSFRTSYVKYFSRPETFWFLHVSPTFFIPKCVFFVIKSLELCPVLHREELPPPLL